MNVGSVEEFHLGGFLCDSISPQEDLPPDVTLRQRPLKWDTCAERRAKRPGLIEP
jgi:hypothetical protein